MLNSFHHAPPNKRQCLGLLPPPFQQSWAWVPQMVPVPALNASWQPVAPPFLFPLVVQRPISVAQPPLSISQRQHVSRHYIPIAPNPQQLPLIQQRRPLSPSQLRKRERQRKANKKYRLKQKERRRQERLLKANDQHTTVAVNRKVDEEEQIHGAVDLDVDVDVVTITASVVTVTRNDSAGTWSWSFDTSDGPGDSQTVTITTTDNDGAHSTAEFALAVNNMAPAAVLTNDETVAEGSTATVRFR